MSWFTRLLGRPSAPVPDVEWLIVGLGNPGPDYVETRHNAGFMVVDALADRLGIGLGAEAARAVIGEGEVPPAAPEAALVPVALAKPLTFMNRSGPAVAALLERYGLAADRLLLVYDDLALPVGSLRLRPTGSAGGHNGVQSVIGALGSTEFPRLRVGVGDSFPAGGQVDFVLSPFDDAEREAVEAALAAAADAALTVVRDGLVAAMNRHNVR